MTESLSLLDFYRKQSAITDPGEHAPAFGGLPSAPAEIGPLLHNVLIHNWKIAAAGLALDEQRRADIETRPVARLLQRIEEAGALGWDVERDIGQRLVVDCRHFAALLCSILRHRSVPARTRHGFASYLQAGHSQSHVICEYWDDARGRWARFDPDTLQPCDDETWFISADAAWRGIRAGVLDPAMFGYAPDLKGGWCVRWELVRDVAALNKREMLTFDIWGLNATCPYDAPLEPADASLLDEIAALLRDEAGTFAALRAIYERDERVKVPRVIRSQPYTTGRMDTIDLVLDGSMAAA
jgi:hypothetical protein